MLFLVLPHTTTFFVMPGVFSNLHGKPAAIPTRIRANSSRLWLGCRPSAVMVAQNQSYCATIEAEIQAHLKKALPVRQRVSVFEPLHYLALTAPQTTAPALCIAACELVGCDREQALDAASAIHLMHAATYTHRHLPLSNIPRAQPPIQHKFGPNIELLTGDALVPFGLELLARSLDCPTQNNPDKILRVIIEITRATGSQGVLDAEYRETQCRRADSKKINIARFVEYVSGKRGLLHACGAACGAIIGGGSEEEIERLRKYGVYVEMINGVGTDEEGMEEKMKEWKVLAMKELEIFKGREVGLISSLLEPNLCSV